MLELAIHQSGNAASKAAAEDASGSGKEGSSAGILKVPRYRFSLDACACICTTLGQPDHSSACCPTGCLVALHKMLA